MGHTKTNQATQIWPAGCNVQSPGLGYRHWSLIVGLKSSPQLLQTLRLWARYFTSLNLSFLTWKMGIISVLTP